MVYSEGLGPDEHGPKSKVEPSHCSPAPGDTELIGKDAHVPDHVPVLLGENDAHVPEHAPDDRLLGERRVHVHASRKREGITGAKFVPWHAEEPPDNEVPDLAVRDVQPAETLLEGKEPVENVMVPVKVGSSNLAGAFTKAVKAVLTHALDYDVVTCQEYAKQKEAGWQLLKGDDFHGVVHQNYIMYRSLAIFYRKSKFQLFKRRQTERRLWVQLKHVESGKLVWMSFPQQ